MTIRLAIWISIGLFLIAGPATAGAQQYQRGPQYQPGPRVQRPVGPQPPQPVRPPFVLTPQQQAHVDAVLDAWERESAHIKRFQCEFDRFDIDGLSADPNIPAHVDAGEIKYESPDKGMYLVKGEKVGGRIIEGRRTEKWVSDGKSVFEYNYEKREVTEHPLPKEMQGKAIANGPMPFLFGAKAADLKARYWICLLRPGNENEIILEAVPKRREDAASYRVAQIILTGATMQPTGLRLIDPNGKDETRFSFTNAKVNSKNVLEFLKGNPFKGNTPLGWSKIVKELPAQQIGGQPPAGSRR
jgi:TIGR03009 family protein